MSCLDPKSHISVPMEGGGIKFDNIPKCKSYAVNLLVKGLNEYKIIVNITADYHMRNNHFLEC